MINKDLINDEHAFTIINDDGLEVECDIFSIIDREEGKNSYIIYTDYIPDENTNFQIYISELEPNGETFNLIEATDYEEIEEVKSALDSAFKKINNKLKEE